jgi:hypothetical protein
VAVEAVFREKSNLKGGKSNDDIASFESPIVVSLNYVRILAL